MALAPQERAFLDSRGVLRLGVDPTWPPFEQLEENGNYAGIASDYVALLSQRLDTVMTPVYGLTWTAVLGGILVGAILNMGICYAGMQIGFTIVGSTVAAVLGFGMLRGVLRRGSILEVNVFQTVGSAVNTVNAGGWIPVWVM